MKLFVFACALTAAAAHICLISPPQRGSMSGINKPDAPDCFLINGPCGHRKMTQQLALMHGKMFTVTFQKNLDHFNSDFPGHFNITIGPLDNGDKKDKGKLLATILDRGEPSLTLYSVNVTIPQDFRGPNQIQAIYAPNNPKAPAVFYQCGDVVISG